MTGSSDEEEEMDTSLSSFLSPPSDIIRPLTTTQHCDDQAIAPATKTKMAASTGTLCPSEPDMDTKIHVTLDNDSLWQEFHGIGTEMLLTRKGRRMFPFCRYTLTGLDPQRLYSLVIDFQLVDENRYRWTFAGRLRGGPSEAHREGGRVYTHPLSPAMGVTWMRVPVTFGTVKLTNNLTSDESLILLHSNHRYIPRLCVVPFDPSRRNAINHRNPEAQTFTFPQTEFYAVSWYQNPRLTELKIKHNPFASAFRQEEMHPGKHMQLPAGGDHETRVSPDSNHAKGNQRAKRRLSLPTAGEFGLGASPVLKKKMAGGLTRTEEMLSTKDKNHNHGVRPRPSRRAPAKLKRRVTFPRVPPHTSTSTPRTLKRPALTSPKTPKTLLHKRKTNSRKNAKGSGVVTETPSEPAEVTLELAVDDVEGMLFVSFANKESHDTHVPVKRELQKSHHTHVPIKREQQKSHETHVPFKRELQESNDTHVPLKNELSESNDTHVPLKNEQQESNDTHVPLKREQQESHHTHVPLKRELSESNDTQVPLKREPPLSPPLNSPPVLQLQEVTRATEPEKATEEVLQERIVQLEKMLLVDLGSFRYRQVVHPALKQVGLKLNLVDPEVAINLQYLGVTLLLPPLLNPSAVLCADGTIPFVSLTGKTNDLTKIKGWRDKYSSSSELPHITPQEGPVKVHSAFSSELLDEYLENEAQRITERAETFFADPVAAGVAYQLPSRSSSYVRTLDSVLKGRSTTTCAPSPVPPLSSTNAWRDTSPAPSSTWPKASPHKTTGPPVTGTAKPSPDTHSAPVHTHMGPWASRSPPDTLMSRALPGGKKWDASVGTSRHGGFTRPQCHLQAMERHAFCQGHTQTYVTKERATIALGVLLTAEGSVKAKRVDLTLGDMLGACQRDFCRLGCVCLSVLRQPRPPTHCRRPQCMFECVCFRHRVLLIRPHPDKNSSSSSSSSSSAHRAEKNNNEDLKLLAYPISNPDKGLRPAPGRRVPLLWEGRADEEDPEPLLKPQEQCVSNDSRASLSAPPKPANKHLVKGPRVKEEDKSSPVYKYFDSMMTCARVRPINSMPPPQVHILPLTNRAKENHLQSPDAPGSRSDAACSQTSVPVALEDEMPSTKLLQIVSECNWEPHRELVLSAINRRLKLDLLTSSFTLGFYRVRLLSVTRHRRQNHCTITYKLSISRGDGTKDKQHLLKSQRPRPKLPLRPGYLKALRLRSGVSPKRLVEVNGKHYAKARLMLGRMGALHPVNRLAAFVTGRLVTFPGSSEDSVVKDAVPGPLADAPPQEPSASQLLYIPIGSPDGATPPAPATSTQSGMLKPVVGYQKGALYRQPNGQLVRLVPLKTLKAMKSTPASSSGSVPGSAPSPAPRAAELKPFSLSGKSTMRISQGSAAVRTLPQTGSFSFRIGPPSERSKAPVPDTHGLKEDQNSSRYRLGGFKLLQLPKGPDRQVRVPAEGTKTVAAAAVAPQATYKSHGKSRQGSRITGTSNRGSQNPGTSVEERRKVVAPVVVPPMASRTLQNNAAAVPPQATRRAHRGSNLRGPGEGPKTVMAPVVIPPTPSRTPHHHNAVERERRQHHQSGFRRLQEVLGITSPKVTKQDILDQAKLVISALKTREKKLEKKKAFMTRTQFDYIKTISQISGKSEETIKKKLEEISKRQRLLEQYRQRLNEKNPGKAQLKLPACDWLTERFAIWKRHKRKRKGKGIPQTSTRPDVKARDSPELRAALLNPGNTATQLSSSSQRSSPSNSSTQGGPNIPLGEDINKVLSLLKFKSLTTSTDPAKPPVVPPPQGNQSGPTMKLVAVPIIKKGEKPSENAGKDGKGLAVIDTPSTTDLTESLAKHAGKGPSRRSSLVPEDGTVVAQNEQDMKQNGRVLKQTGKDMKQNGRVLKQNGRVLKQNGRVLKHNGRILKGSCLDVDVPDDHSESLAEDTGNISPSGSQAREVPTQGEAPDCNDEEPEEQPSLNAAVARGRAKQQCADEAAAVGLTSAESSKEAVCAALQSSLLVENGVPKPRRGRPPKQAKAAPSLTEAKTRPPPPQKVKHSPRLHPEGRQLRSRSPVLRRAHTRRGQRRGRK